MGLIDRTTIFRAMLMTLLGGALLGACNGDAKGPSEKSAENSSSAGSTSQGIDDTALMQKERPHTADGTLTMDVQGVGVGGGTASFEDVTAYIDEKAAAGGTQNILSLEAHDGPGKRHFRIRVTREDGEMTTGTYSLKDAGDRRLDARFEQGGMMYNSVGGGEGTVVLEKVGDGRVAGKFDLALPLINGGTGAPDSTTPRITLRGTFDQAVK